MSFKVLSLFSGIGAFEKALDNLGIEYELVNYCEIDKYASKSYAAIHGVDESLNLGDITTVDTSKLPNDIDLLTHGSPCQSFSLAGLQHGGDKGSGTQSSLMWETVRIISDIKPKIIIWENVKNVLSKKHKHNFDAYIEQLDELNYNSYHKILNSRDFGIPQNRERIFVVSIRKDIDNGFEFPKAVPLQLRLKDMLDDEVDEKYYLSKEQIDRINNSNFMQEKKRLQEKDYVDTLLARDYKDPKCVAVEPKRIGGLFDTETSKHQAGSIWDKECISPTIDTMQGGYRQPLVTTDDNISNDEIKINVIGNYSPSGHDASRIVDENGLAPTVKENHGTVTATMQNLRIRKLTPKECWKLMGFDDEDFEKAEKVNSNTQLYKQAGNSIVVDVLEHIFSKLNEFGYISKLR